jgi:hypothetical protein
MSSFDHWRDEPEWPFPLVNGMSSYWQGPSKAGAMDEAVGVIGAVASQLS